MENSLLEMRIKVMLAVRASHDEEYYKQAARSTGADINKLTHAEIAAYKAAMDCVEADLIIDIAKNQEVSLINNTVICKELLSSMLNADKKMSSTSEITNNNS